MNNVALGQYMPLDSVVHKMDPRSKIMIMLFLMVAIFIPAGVLGYVIIGIFILLSLYLSKLNIKYALRTMKPMLWMMAFLLVINLLVIKTGTPLFSIKGFTICRKSNFVYCGTFNVDGYYHNCINSNNKAFGFDFGN